MNSRVAHGVGDRQRTAGPQRTAGQTLWPAPERPEESFADHLQADPPPAALSAERRELPATEGQSADPPPHPEPEAQTADESQGPPAEMVALPTESTSRPADDEVADPTAPHHPDQTVTTPEKPGSQRDASAGRVPADAHTPSDASRYAADLPNTAPSDPAASPATHSLLANQTADAPVTQVPPTPSAASLPPSTDRGVEVPSATTPALAAAPATTTPETATTADKPAGKPKSDKASPTTRSAAPRGPEAGVPSQGVAQPGAALASETQGPLAGRVAGILDTELSAPPPTADPPTATGGREGDTRTPAGDHATVPTERLAEHLAARSGAASHATHELTPADQLRLIQRVARAMEAASQRGGLLRLRLSPPELGALRLEVSLHDGSLSARIETETQAVKTLLLDQLPQLRDRLAEHGFRVERFDVDVSQHQSTDTPWEPHDTDDRALTGPRRRRADPAPELPDDAAAATRVPVHAQPGKLNVVI